VDFPRQERKGVKVTTMQPIHARHKEKDEAKVVAAMVAAEKVVAKAVTKAVERVATIDYFRGIFLIHAMMVSLEMEETS